MNEWATAAARELIYMAEENDNELVVESYRDVILRHLPRCDRCRHWAPLKQPEHTWSSCMVLSTGTVVSTPDDDIVQTRADFGCVQWEAK